MSKGIIVMDIPENCEDCPCCHTDNYDFYCKRNGNHVDWEENPDWCPIRPMPDIVNAYTAKRAKRLADEGL